MTNNTQATVAGASMTSISNPITSQGPRQGMAKPSSIQNRTGTAAAASTANYGQNSQLLASSAEGTGQNITDMIQKREISSTYIKRILDNQQMIK
jgi:hypothetical protein